MIKSKTNATKKTKIEESLTALPINTEMKTKQNNRVSQIAISNYTLSGRNLQQTPSPIAQSRVTGLDAQIYTNLTRD